MYEQRISNSNLNTLLTDKKWQLKLYNPILVAGQLAQEENWHSQYHRNSIDVQITDRHIIQWSSSREPWMNKFCAGIQ